MSDQLNDDKLKELADKLREVLPPGYYSVVALISAEPKFGKENTYTLMFGVDPIDAKRFFIAMARHMDKPETRQWVPDEDRA